jgi:RNA polymerase sigma-70 factor, ECF subfamily
VSAELANQREVLLVAPSGPGEQDLDQWLKDASADLTNRVAAAVDVEAALAQVRGAAASCVVPEARQATARAFATSIVAAGGGQVISNWETSWASRDEVRALAQAPHTATTTYAPQADNLQRLVEAAAGRDRVATQQLLESIRPIVLRYCRARIGRIDRSFASADDVVQEVCLSIISALPGYRDEGRPFLAFVYGIAKRKVAEAHLAVARNRSLPVPVVPDRSAVVAESAHPAERENLKDSMGQLLAVLSDKQREIVVSRVVVGLSAEETADLVGSTPGAVRTAQHRALNRLRKVVGNMRVP